MDTTNDPIRQYYRQRLYSRNIVAGGIDYVISRWENIASRVAAGYPRMMYDEYLNDMDARRILSEGLHIATPEQRGQLADRVKAADELYLNATVPVAACIWGPGAKAKYGWQADTEWWYYRVPKARFSDWYTGNGERNGEQ